ncbi:hypothetical protein [uncultured Roseobacter sp.]|uniref:hypothetical protein n=1 Tax=uncultured Roseobacter sp. TaxID=114847 RepID=UPI002613D833|nr:hypothetical protein [uncultured Roseobacter sp.]
MNVRAQPLRKPLPTANRQAKPQLSAVGGQAHVLQAIADRASNARQLGVLQRMADGRARTNIPATPVIQAYGLTDEAKDPVWRVSDSDKSAVPQDQDEGGNKLYATPDIIKDGDKKLLAASSAIGLHQSDDEMKLAGETVYGVAPYLRDQAIADVDHDRTKKLKQINAGDLEDDEGVTDDEIMALWTDCGKAARTIMGVQDTGKSPKATTNIGDSAPSGNPADYSNELYPKAIKAFFGSKANKKFLKKNVHYTTNFIGWVSFVKPKDPKHARKMYSALGEEGREAFDKHVGINRFANPEIGDAYTMVTEKDMPGFKSSGRTWNFHWAGVIAKDGGDNLTLEGYAVSAASEIKEAKETMSGQALKDEIARLRKWAADYVDRDWLFQMYGTKRKGETFHDDHLGSGTHGNRATTFHATK